MVGDKTGETKCGISGRIFLKKGRLVRFVDDDESEVVQGRKKGGTRTDNDFGGV